MKPEWRTPAVTGLCDVILGCQVMGAKEVDFMMPLLADALTDAGCDDKKFLKRVRGSEKRGMVEIQRLANMISSEERAEAVRWIEDFADRWHFGYEYEVPEGEEYGDYVPGDGYAVLVEAAAQEMEHGEDPDDYGRYVTAMGIDLHSPDELGDDHDKFWETLEMVTNRRFDAAHRGGFHWSCSC